MVRIRIEGFLTNIKWPFSMALPLHESQYSTKLAKERNKSFFNVNLSELTLYA